MGRPAGPRQGRRAAGQDERDPRRRLPEAVGGRSAPTSASTSSAPTRACARWSSTCPTTSCSKLRRGGHDYRKLYAAYAAAVEHRGLADRDPGQDGQGLDARPRHRGAQRHPPGQEADRRRAEDLPRPAGAADPRRAAQGRRPTTAPAPTRPRCSTCSSAAAQLGGSLPQRVVRPKPLPNAARRGLRRALRRARERPAVHDHGLQPADAQPDPRQADRPPHRADHPRRGAHLRHGRRSSRRSASTTRSGQQYTPVDKELLLSYVEKTDGQILEEGITEAGAMASFTAAAPATPCTASR